MEPTTPVQTPEESTASEISDIIKSRGMALQKKIVCTIDEAGVPHFDCLINVVKLPVPEVVPVVEATPVDTPDSSV